MFKTEFKTTPMEGRFAWCYLDKPRVEDMSGKKLEKPKYECQFYFAKTAARWDQCANARFFADQIWGVVANVFRGAWPLTDQRTGAWDEWPINDCDDAAYLEKYPWARGMWRVKLSGGEYRPKVFDAGNNPIELGTDGKFRPGTFKGGDGSGGDWGLASVNAFEWSYGNKKGVSLGCEGIKVTRLDEALGGGGRSGEQMFGAPSGQPVYGAAPPQPAPPPLPQGYAPQPSYAPNPTQPPAPYAPTPGAPAQTSYATAPAPPYAGATYPSNGGYPPNPPQGGGPYAPTAAPAPMVAPGPYSPPAGPGAAVYPSSAPQQGGMPPPPPMSGGWGGPPQAPAYAPQIGQR